MSQVKVLLLVLQPRIVAKVHFIELDDRIVNSEQIIQGVSKDSVPLILHQSYYQMGAACELFDVEFLDHLHFQVPKILCVLKFQMIILKNKTISKIQLCSRDVNSKYKSWFQKFRLYKIGIVVKFKQYELEMSYSGICFIKNSRFSG